MTATPETPTVTNVSTKQAALRAVKTEEHTP